MDYVLLLREIAMWLLILALPAVVLFVFYQTSFVDHLRKHDPGYIEFSSPKVKSVFVASSPLWRQVLVSKCYLELNDPALNRLGARSRLAERVSSVMLYTAAAAAFAQPILGYLPSSNA